jgi:hypothetical protein
MSQTAVPSGPRARPLISCALAAALWLAVPAAAQERMASAGAASEPPAALVAPAPAPQAAVRVAIPITEPWLMGMTGLHTSDGVRAQIVTNFGVLIEARIERDRAGRPVALRPVQGRALAFPDGRALTNGFRAAEGLAVAQDGRIFVSFEYHTRVWTYRSPEAPPQDLGRHEDFARFANGLGLASLALAPDGALYAIPERPARMTHGFPSYRWQDGVWTGSFRVPSEGAFLPVDAAFGPDGWLYVLEHEGAAPGGRSQIRRFAVQGDRMGRGQVLMRSTQGQFGYLAGLAVWRNRSGQLVATMVADNGGSAERPGELVEVVLPR